ncbi:undecaprenyldiphospho-muramoylpentapeptide beta-N-acetylglucosaminyltransferase [Thiosocius teredinicola]|uniref:undecaprenyldiphospho-muramoylpentapeptide beta-N-acetylglucosaminyltransferase n=1 Tax=Thiosocius teredinicola TaxID=1973002 RepID=UPI002FE4D73E
MATRITIMAGGTGGHVFPALAVAHELAARGWQVNWLGTPDSFEARTVPQHGFALDTMNAHRLRGKGLLNRMLGPVYLLRAMLQAWKVLRMRRPQVVLGMGGFVSGPGGLVSRLMHTPLVVHEQNAIPGLTNRWLARVASRVLEAFPGSFAASAGAIAIGNPIRKEIADLGEPQPIDAQRALRVLVLGGSLGAQALNEQVPLALAQLAEDLRPEIRHQAGRGKEAATVQAYEQSGVSATVTEFVDDMAEAYSWADLVICRSGALTVSELMAAGKAALLVPFPFAVDDHQTVNAGFLVDAGAAQLIQQRDITTERLADLLRELLSDRERLHAMGAKAYAIAKRDSAQRVADVCEELAA